MILQKILYLPGLGYEVIGFVDGGDLETVAGVPVLGRIGALPSLIDGHSIDEVIIALPEASHEEILTIISLCEREKVSIKVYPDVFQIMAAQVSIGDLGGLPLLTVRDVALRGWRLTLKRMVDLIGSAIGLVVLSPLLLLVAALGLFSERTVTPILDLENCHRDSAQSIPDPLLWPGISFIRW